MKIYNKGKVISNSGEILIPLVSQDDDKIVEANKPISFTQEVFIKVDNEDDLILLRNLKTFDIILDNGRILKNSHFTNTFVKERIRNNEHIIEYSESV